MREESLDIVIRKATVVFRMRRRGRGKEIFRAVDDVSFDVPSGQTTAIVGESGSGKSSVLKAIVGLNRLTSGTIVFPTIRDSRREIQMVFQDPFGSLNPRMRVRKLLEEQLFVAGVRDRAERRARVDVALEQVGLSEGFEQRYPHQMSGGQRQRVAIARSLTVSPRILLLDEPLSALDVTVQAQIVRALRRLQDDLGLTYLFVTHDLALASEIANEVVVMLHGRVVESGPADQVFGDPQHEYTKRLIAAIPDPLHC